MRDFLFSFATSRRWLVAALLAATGPALAQTTNFAYTGGTQTYTVPAGVTKIVVVATGAGGGAYLGVTPQAFPGQVQATLTVTPNEVLTVVVGGQGGTGNGANVPGGYNGGGSGYAQGAGGGATDLRRASANGNTGDYLTTRNALLVAGGAGGSGISPAGGNGGTPNGGNGTATNGGTGGTGGTTTAAGTSAVAASNGSNGNGGNASNNGFNSGGGGGYYGGGAGAGAPLPTYAATGGGGSSYVLPTGASNITYSLGSSVNSNGSLSITPVIPTSISSFTPTSGPTGTSVAITGTNLLGTTAVSLNGTAGTITGTPTATNLNFTVAAGSTSGAITLVAPGGTAASAPNPVLRLQATGGTSSDNTAYLDQVEILQNGAVVAGVSNGSFETGAPAGTLTSPGTAVAPWTFGGSARLSTTASAFAPPAPPDASAHVVVLQLGGCYVEQALSLGAGTYQVRFQLAQRQCCATPYDQGINVFINGMQVGTSLTTSSAGYVSLVSAPFSVSTAGTFTVIPSPTITSISPNPGVRGEAVTITGTNLTGVTAVSVNGVAVNTASFVNNTATSLTFQVPATAGGSGTTSVTTASGTASVTNFTTVAATPPGNALAFDGVDDYVPFGSTPAVNNLGPGSFTMEAWVYYDGGTSAESIIRKDGDYNLYILNNTLNAEIWSSGTGSSTWRRFAGTTTLPANRWAHVAAVWNGSSIQLYVNGVADAGALSTGSVTASANLTLGKSQIYGNLLNGRLDEVRIYTAALTQANIQADMLSTSSAVPGSLKFYLDFDQGTASGNNAAQTTLYDQSSNAYAGTLTNYNAPGLSSGNTTSNWVESYALVVPTATAATAVSYNTFTANWTAPAVGTVSNYLVDVSTSSTFASVISGSPFSVATGTTSLVLSGQPGGTYYYRVRANKTSVTGQGAYSGTISVMVPSATLSCAAAANNALNFDGSNDYVRTTSLLPNTGEFTIETWVNPTTLPGGLFSGLLLSDDFPGGAMHWQFSSNVLRFTINGNVPSDQDASFTVPTGSWSHVAVVYSASAKTAKFYLNGALQVTRAYTTAVAVGAQPYSVGGWFSGGPQRLLNGSLNEMRVWSVARTDAQILASYNQALPAQSGLAILYSFDQGVASGNNAGLTTLNDDSGNGHPGTLNSFALTGSASNWVAGNSLAYTLGLTSFSPSSGAQGTPVTLTGSGFTGATAVRFNGTVASSFTVVNGSTITAVVPACATTGTITVTGPCGTVTSTGSFTVCALPVALAQNVSLTLNASGNAILAATAVNNGSTANCGAATAAALSVSPSSFSCADVVPATVASALSFNGSGQYVAIGNTATVPLGNSAYTIEAWIKPNQMGDYGIIGWGNYGFNDQVNALRLYPGGIHNYWWAHDLSGATGNLAGTWHHVAATFDGTTRRIYLDGALLNSDAPGSSHAVPNANNLRIGSTNNGEYFPGSIDEVRVWSVARTQAQLNTAKGIGLPGGTTGLVAYYRLNEGSGLNTTDATGNAANLGTLTNGPTWTTDAAPVMNGSPVTLTVTDTGGNTNTATAIVAVRDNAAPAAPGSGPLPAAPTLATSNVPEAGNYGVLYQYDVPNVASLNGLSAIPYTVNNSGVSIATPARVAYFMELSNGTSSKWVWASMDNFASTLTQLGLPNPTANNVNFHRNVTNLNVFSSAGAGVTTGTGIGTGRIEMWYWNYGTGNTDNVPGASGSTYDFGDDPNVGSGNYGSFQVHNVTAGQTLLAYNNWGGNGDGGGIGNIGIGNQVGGSGNPDWTFTYNANAYTVKRIYILVPNNGAFTQPATVVLNASGTATLTQSQVYTGAVDNCAVSSVIVSPTTFTCAQTSTPQLVTVAVSDASGNTTTQSAYVTVTVPPTTTTTWNGSSSTVWSDCANWSYGKVPDAATNVVIPTGQPRYPVLASGTAPVLDLTVNSGGSLTLNSGATLQVNGSFASSGTATLSGTVAFVGSSATQMLNVGTGFNTVTVNKPSGTVQLAQNLTINTDLTLTSGTLTTTGSYQVNLGGSASLSESDASYVLGKVVVNRTLAPGTAETFAGLGLTLTPAAGSVAPGATLVSRTTGAAISGAGTSQSILRNFNIQPAVNTGLNVTMNFAYFTHELNGIPVGNLALFKSVSGGTPWIPQRGTTAGTNVITKTGITDFSVWTLGNSANPLPVELVTFTATVQGHAVQLKWSTASEKNTARFEVERSIDATVFERIGIVPAAGTSTTLRAYDLLDNQIPKPLGAPIYYRLRQVDQDGTFAYSPVRSVRLSETAEGLALVPNPTTTATTLTGAQPGTRVQVYDALGRVVAAATADATGSATLALPAGLATGVYVVRAGTQALRLLVE